MPKFGFFLVLFGLATPLFAHPRDGVERVRQYCSHALAGLSALPGFYFLDGKKAGTRSRASLIHQLEFSRPRLVEQQKALQKEIALPRGQRREQDPRSWSFLRRDATNPVRVRLEAEAALVAARLANAERAEKLLGKLETLSRVPLRADRLDAIVFMWLGERAEEISVTILRRIVPGGAPGEAGTIEDCRADASVLADLEVDLERLEPYLKGTGRHNPQIREVFEGAWRSVRRKLEATLKPGCGREVAAEILDDLIRLALKTQKSFREVAQRFQEFDTLAQEHRTDIQVKDEILVLLTEIVLTRPTTAAETFRRFKLVDKITSSARAGFFLFDPEVAVLVDLTYVHGISPEALCTQFFKIVNLGRTRAYSNIQSRACILLTHLSLLIRQTDWEIVELFAEIRDAAESADEKVLADNDLALALLIPQAWRRDWEESAQAAVQDYRRMRMSMEAAGQRHLEEEVLSRLVGYMTAYQRQPENVASDWDVVLDIEGRSASAPRVLTILELAYSGSQDGDDLWEFTLPPRLVLENLVDSLREDTPRRRRLRRQAGG